MRTLTMEEIEAAGGTCEPIWSPSVTWEWTDQDGNVWWCTVDRDDKLACLPAPTSPIDLRGREA